MMVMIEIRISGFAWVKMALFTGCIETVLLYSSCLDANHDDDDDRSTNHRDSRKMASPPRCIATSRSSFHACSGNANWAGGDRYILVDMDGFASEMNR